MKILVICQYYYPEPFKVHDICKALVEEGHVVDVVTGTPNYPMGEVYEGYENGKKRDEIIDGVRVHRCRIVPRKKDAIHRLINYLDYPRVANNYLKKNEIQYDVVFVYQLSPVLMGIPAIYYKKKHKTKIVLYCLDIWPESLKAGGVKESSLLYKFFKAQSMKVYNGADKILVTSKSFINYLEQELSVSKRKIEYFPQYAEAIYERKTCIKKPNKTIDLMFAGNLGKMQGLELIIDAAEQLRNMKNLQIHFVGDGQEYENLQKIVKNKKLKNVHFYGRKPVKDMPKYYAKADAMLVTLKKGSSISNTIPGKVQTYMAAGKPIIGSIDGEARNVIMEAKCGFCGSAENVDDFVGCIKQFIAFKNKEELGNNAYNYYNANFSKRQFISRLNGELK